MPWRACILVLLLFTACYEAPVSEHLLLTFEQDGSLKLNVETLLLPRGERTTDEQDRIQRVLDAYALGRDPWLRGFEKVEARNVSHRLEMLAEGRQAIQREGVIPSVESLHRLMPDATANLRLIENREERTRTLEIVPIDLPESIRQEWRRLDREVETLATVCFGMFERQCDLYDYLASAPDRVEAVVGSLDDDEAPSELLSGEEAALIFKLRHASEALEAFAVDERWGPKGPLVARLTYSAFEHDFCVRIPSAPLRLDGFAPQSVEPAETAVIEKERPIFCVERLDLIGLLGAVGSTQDPPMMGTEITGDRASREKASFTCRRYDDAAAVEKSLWEKMLPRVDYSIAWQAP